MANFRIIWMDARQAPQNVTADQYEHKGKDDEFIEFCSREAGQVLSVRTAYV